MQYKILDKAGFKISQVSFGCMSLKDKTPENDAIIGKAIENGINLFDTADLYDKGENEKLLGQALKGKRNEVFISTKVGNRWRDDGTGWDWVPEKEYILKAVDESLKRLQTDYIDLYLLHGGTIEDPVDEVIEAFEGLAKSGKIRAYGISSIRPSVIREYVKRSNIAAVMTQYSILDRRPEEATLSLVQENNIGVLARGTVASGLLAGKETKEYLGLSKQKVEDIVESIEKLMPQSKKLSQTAMRYVIDNPAITTAVVGIRTKQQLADALDVERATPLSLGELRKIQSVWEGNTYREHR
ncbi:aldo/keto reductase [Flavobacterium sp. Sd200]|uniref:aldo/keto reductase n=1 Tax=Flavobacterium sp. Sd200 TaxID=2692211 RepID=UPI001370A64E|nr:aldo/keto reductase [Flavobacterium sp. Sd200]MXN90252.1 aldo/keto reductase [Flavobacterium sp. Sd200]